MVIPILEGLNITKRFGGLVAVDNFSFFLDKNELVGLIGPNGAGKTTLFNCITKIEKPTSGVIKLEGKNITHLKPHEVARIGIARTFQIPRYFPSLTVLQNVALGCISLGYSMSRAYETAKKMLKYVHLDEKIDLKASSLNMQEKRLLEIAKALSLRPKVLLLDEVAAGLIPSEIAEIRKVINEIREEFDLSIMWVEHVMDVIMKAADRVIVMNEGKKIAEGPPVEVARNKKVIEVYLGERYKEVTTKRAED